MLALSRREQLLCACLLVMILCVSASGAWLTWRALKDEQVQLQGQSAVKTGTTADHSIETDLTKRDTFELTKPAPPARGTASGEPTSGSGPSLQTSQPTTIDGTVVAAVVSVVLLGAGAGVARLVVARYRREHVQGPGALSAEPSSPDRIGSEADADSDELDVHGDALPQDAALRQEGEEAQRSEEAETEGSEQPASASERQQPAATEPVELERSGLVAPDERPGVGPLLEARSTALPESESLLDTSLIPAPRSASWDARQEASVGGGGPQPPLASPLLDESSSFGRPAADAASENIFDRRAARRVPYVQPAWLWWGEAKGKVMVQDLSATGLRLRLPSPGPAQRPALGQSLRISFPVGGTTVEANGRVQWRRTVDRATEVGLQFLDMSATDQELIQSVLLEAE